MVVHGDHHRNEYDGVVEEMYFCAKLRQQQLQETDWDRRAKPVVMSEGLPLQDRVFDVMPELDRESNGPPFPRRTRKTLSQHPNSNQHHDRIAVMQNLRADKPRIKQTEDTIRRRPRPAEHINLKSLREVLGPVREHDQHKQVQRAFMPNRIEFLVKGHSGA